jgi:hypothetical protein
MLKGLPKSYTDFCYVNSTEHPDAPFELLIGPTLFLTTELPGLSTTETQYMGVFDLDPVIASLAIDFIGYERRFNQDLLTLMGIVEDVATTHPVLTQSLTCSLHELSIAH